MNSTWKHHLDHALRCMDHSGSVRVTRKKTTLADSLMLGRGIERGALRLARLLGLARVLWRAPTEEPGGVLWETEAGRRRSFSVKRCGWH